MRHAIPQAIFVSALALAMPICASGDPLPDRNPLLRGLEKVEGSRVTLAYQRPGTRWDTYRTVLLLPLDVRVAVYDPAAVQQMYADEMSAAFAKKRFVVVATPRADTLIVGAQLYQIISGSLSIKMGFSDGSTRTMVAAMSDFESAKGLISDRNDVVNEARNAIATWGRIVAGDLKDLADAADVNPIECFKWSKDCH